MGSIFLDAPLFLCFDAYLKNVMKSSKSKTSNLKAIRKLIDELSDRDIKIKRDISLFEEFFSSFPIPVTIWSISKEGTVVSKRGNGLVCENAKCINTLFEEFDKKKQCIEMHQKALQGRGQQALVTANKKMYYISVVPRRDENEKVSGIMGLAWDVTPNYEILMALEVIVKECEGPNPNYEIIKSKSENALTSSRLQRLLDLTTKGD